MDLRAYTKQEAREYVCRPGVVAPCWNSDILSLVPAFNDIDAWYLGSTPVRFIKLVGMVVGVDQWDNGDNYRTSHFIDDGTRVLECHETITKIQPIQPSHPSAIPPVIEPITPPRRFNVGAVVRIVGTVQHQKGLKARGYNRQVTLQSIDELLDLREECLHWQQVHDLHINQYSKLFSVPPPPALPVQSTVTTPTRGRNLRVQDPESPTFSRSSVVSCYSPIQSSEDASSGDLIHPSLIRSRDLTAKTFGYYLKYYMAHEDFHSTSKNPEDTSDPATPTQNRLRNNAEYLRPSFDRPGFTLEYLRNVPDLRYLARRIVLAEAKRREREVRKVEKDKLRETQLQESGSTSHRHHRQSSQSNKHVAGSSSGRKAPPIKITVASLTHKMKKLFEVTIRSLYREGEIIVVPGPGRKWHKQSPALDSQLPYPARLGGFRLWSNPPIPWTPSMRADVSGPSLNTAASSANSSKRTHGANEYDDLIDEDPSSPPGMYEECYLPLTPELLSGKIKNIVRTHSFRSAQNPLSTVTLDRMMVILKQDEMWSRVGQWSVVESLSFLAAQDQIWEQLPGHWVPL